MFQILHILCRMQINLSPQQRVVDLLLGQQGSNLKDWLAARRDENDSYETIAKKLWTLTAGEIDVSYTTVKRWLIDFDLLEAVS